MLAAGGVKSSRPSVSWGDWGGRGGRFTGPFLPTGPFLFVGVACLAADPACVPALSVYAPMTPHSPPVAPDGRLAWRRACPPSLPASAPCTLASGPCPASTGLTATGLTVATATVTPRTGCWSTARRGARVRLSMATSRRPASRELGASSTDGANAGTATATTLPHRGLPQPQLLLPPRGSPPHLWQPRWHRVGVLLHLCL